MNRQDILKYVHYSISENTCKLNIEHAIEMIPPRNGDLYSTEDELLDVVCEQGYTRIPAESLTTAIIYCRENGQWLNSDIVKCQGKDIKIERTNYYQL